MKTKRLVLKKWASTVIYLSVISIVFISMVFISNKINETYNEGDNLSYILKSFIDDKDITVVNYTNEEVIKPFDSESVSIDIDYYDKDESNENQEKSLILYENTYMPNTGILYSSNETFDIISTLDGTITKVSEDELLGNVVEITHSPTIVTTYYSLGEVKVTEGQSVKQGDIIGISGKNNISSTSDNMMLFEVSLNGNNINPENYYGSNLKDLNQ